MFKLAVIGKGTAGSLAYNHFANYTDWEIECYYDTLVKEQSVGEGTTITLPRTLHYTLGFEFHQMKQFNGNYKNGIHYIDWAEENYMHTFPAPDISMHFSAVDLQRYIADKNKNRVAFKDIKVNNVYDIDADYIIDCSGTPNKFDDFEFAKYIPVNTAYVRQCNWDYPKYDYTICIAAEWGWIFGIPLSNRMSWGYMYNQQITDHEVIKKQLLEVIDNYGMKPTAQENRLDFNNYYRKENFFENIAYNGNASFFLEPMEATSLTTVDNINRKIYDSIVNKESIAEHNAWYTRTFKELQDIIVMHYLGATKYDNEFWTYAKKLATDCLSDNKLTKKQYTEILDNINNIGFDLVYDYGVWRMHSFNQNINSLGILNKLKELNVQEEK